jgi:ring-1,2-phenylacetyl-CoA epoxidase subunit PaaE
VNALVVDEVVALTDDAVAIAFAVPTGLAEAYRHAPGQHVVVLHPHGGGVIRRPYSICSPVGSERMWIAVRRIRGGVFSGFATEQLTAGETLHVMVPTGSFTVAVDPAAARRLCAVAAGSGITPVLSIVSSVLESEPESRVTLLYGNRRRSSTMFFDRLLELRAQHPDRLSLHLAYSRQADDPHAMSGRINPDLLDQLMTVSAVDDWFLCGPEPMTNAIGSALMTRGVASDRVHRELFFDDSPPVTPAHVLPDNTAEVTVRLNGEDLHFSLNARGESILAAVLRLRNTAPYACRDGVCGTCRAQLVTGEVAMERTSALSRQEREDGAILACQSHPVSENVVVDFDC